MTLSTFKKFETFVNEELEKFYEELDDNSKNYKAPVDINKTDYKYTGSSFNVDKVKKKEKIKKVKKEWNGVNNDKGLF